MSKRIRTSIVAASLVTMLIALIAQLAIINSAHAQVTASEGFTVEVFATQVTNQTGPAALAFDSQGNLYIAPGDSGVLKIPAGTNVPQAFGAVGIGDPDGVAVDSQDNIIVSGNPITKFAPDGSVIWQIGGCAGNIQGVAVDSNDNVYVGRFGTQICKIPPDGSSVTSLGAFSSTPNELAVSPDGFLFVAHTFGANITKATLDTAEVLEVVVSGVSPEDPVFDASGNLLINDLLTGSLLKISFPDKTISTIASGFTFPQGLAIDMEGNLFVFDNTADKVIYKILSTAPPLKIEVPVDIKPQSCPNPLNVKSKGVLPVAILGTVDFDVRTIDVATISLNGVAPIKSAFEDATTPAFKIDRCDCEVLDPDSFEDMVLKFDTQEIVTSLGVVQDGEEITLTLTGNLLENEGGTAIEGTDCVLIKAKGK